MIARVAVLSTLAVVCSAAVNPRPIVGILTLPSPQCDSFAAGRSGVFLEGGSGGGSCFTSFYTQWLSSAGVRVVPIPYNATTEKLDELYSYLNGMLFTGGGLDLLASTGPDHAYFQSAKYLFDLASTRKEIPLWGTCMGFQLLNILAAGDGSILSSSAFDSENLPLALDLTPDAAKSRIFGGSGLDSTAMHTLTTENVTENLHHDGVTPSSFYGNKQLSSFFMALSTNKGRQGREFISTVEARDPTIPIWGTQWHPERNGYEFNPVLNINHSPEAVKAMQGVVNFLADQARLNDHSFPDAATEAAALIYNWIPVSAQHDSYQLYNFPFST